MKILQLHASILALGIEHLPIMSVFVLGERMMMDLTISVNNVIILGLKSYNKCIVFSSHK